MVDSLHCPLDGLLLQPDEEDECQRHVEAEDMKLPLAGFGEFAQLVGLVRLAAAGVNLLASAEVLLDQGQAYASVGSGYQNFP